MDAAQIISIIRHRQAEFWDMLRVNDAVYDSAIARAVVNEYDALLIEIGAIKPEEAKSA
jgi:hypothetical protein